MDNHRNLGTNGGAHLEVNEKVKCKLPWFMQAIQWLANKKLHSRLKTGYSNSEKPAKQGNDFYMKD